MINLVKNLLLKGKHGVGKTTIIEKIIDVLRERYQHIQIIGLITKEVRCRNYFPFPEEPKGMALGFWKYKGDVIIWHRTLSCVPKKSNLSNWNHPLGLKIPFSPKTQM